MNLEEYCLDDDVENDDHVVRRISGKLGRAKHDCIEMSEGL